MHTPAHAALRRRAAALPRNEGRLSQQCATVDKT